MKVWSSYNAFFVEKGDLVYLDSGVTVKAMNSGEMPGNWTPARYRIRRRKKVRRRARRIWLWRWYHRLERWL